jgi:hypothetical protein
MSVTALEKHYTAKEVAKLWGLSEDTIRDLFRDDPAVLKIERPARRFKRAYVSIRIPESVVLKRHAELRSGRKTVLAS